MRKIATSLLIILLLGSCSSVSESHEQTIVETNDLFPGEYWVNEDDYYDGHVVIDIWDEAEDEDIVVYIIEDEKELALLITQFYDEGYYNLYYKSDNDLDINKVYLYTLALSPYEIWWEDYYYEQENGEIYYEADLIYDFDDIHEVNKAIDILTYPYLSTYYPKDAQVEYIYEDLLQSITYDDNAINDTERTSDSFTAYGALINNLAVCHGYSLAFEAALKDIDIPSIVISSEIDDHAWNMVYYDNAWTFFDITYEDDTNNPEYYYYFALTKEDLEYDHSFDESSDNTLSYDESIDLANFVFDVE